MFYWLERNQEVDFILSAGNNVAAIDVKMGRRRERLFGMEVFSKAFRVKCQLLVGRGLRGLFIM
jgi:hypothetical protein